MSREPFCKCKTFCGDDGDTDGPGVCRLLPIRPIAPIVEIVLVAKHPEAREPSDSYDRGDG